MIWNTWHRDCSYNYLVLFSTALRLLLIVVLIPGGYEMLSGYISCSFVPKNLMGLVMCSTELVELAAW